MFEKCFVCGKPVHEDDAIYIYGWAFCSADCASDGCYGRCDHCGEWEHDMFLNWLEDEEEVWCDNCIDKKED